jgi:dTDP-glucose 4,6-dehydratase
MNLIGERQGREKYLPKLIYQISRGETVTVHGSPSDIGTRHYLHARNLADAMLFILRNLPPARFTMHAGHGERKADRPDRYNVAGPDRISNLQLAQAVAQILGMRLQFQLKDFHSTRPGHDPHYGLDGSKLAAAGWKPPMSFEASLTKTVQWTLSHQEWLED